MPPRHPRAHSAHAAPVTRPTHAADPARDAPPRQLPVAGLLLAAGGGRRLGGRPKALLPHGGRPLVEHAAGVLRAGGCEPLHIVLGAAAREVRARAELPGCRLVDNPAWAEGMGTSLRAGLASLAPTAATAALVLLVDQPGIGPEAVARLIARHRAGGEAVVQFREERQSGVGQ
ncbi:nucleotidyltransferase family protein, partial [Streptomyces sp. URMC 123]|uniref:nucleotidyltransferase family protein n=1 Tax=Streptomyces sp. URMC 123 TaxID=3423403 RepID=UPI003F1A5BAD